MKPPVMARTGTEVVPTKYSCRQSRSRRPHVLNAPRPRQVAKTKRTNWPKATIRCRIVPPRWAMPLTGTIQAGTWPSGSGMEPEVSSAECRAASRECRAAALNSALRNQIEKRPKWLGRSGRAWRCPRLLGDVDVVDLGRFGGLGRRGRLGRGRPFGRSGAVVL